MSGVWGHLTSLRKRIQTDESVPALARELFAAQAEEYALPHSQALALQRDTSGAEITRRRIYLAVSTSCARRPGERPNSCDLRRTFRPKFRRYTSKAFERPDYRRRERIDRRTSQNDAIEGPHRELIKAW